jgi:hypothetical protein
MLASATRPVFPHIPAEPNVAVFKTNVSTERAAFVVVRLVQAHFAGCRVTLDLDDHECILRVQDRHSQVPLAEDAIRRLVSGLGYAIEALVD